MTIEKLADNIYPLTQVDKINEIIDDLNNLNSAETDMQADIGNIASDLNAKADRDLTNITNPGKLLISDTAMPSNVIVKITTGASGSSYTAPANGWFRVSSSASSSTSGWIYMTSSSGLTNQPSNTANNGINGFLPCKKGDVVTMQFWGLANTPYICFVYAQGSAVNK